MSTPGNDPVIGRLLEEISWEGSSVRAYRNGGRGRENVLTAEVIMMLDFLPRDAFLGQVFRSAHGADAARALAAEGAESAVVTMLPEETKLGNSEISVQPDATIVTPSCHLIEAKRIRTSSFQPEQLAREYVAVLQDARTRIPLLLVILGEPPPVNVQGSGRKELQQSIEEHLDALLERTDAEAENRAALHDSIGEHVAWTTWSEIRQIAIEASDRLVETDSISNSARRLSASLVRAIDWHA